MTFTDGLVDLKNGNDEYFDDQHIENTLVRNEITTAAKFNEELQEAMDTFRGDQDFPDDIAVLTCKFDR